MIHSFFKKVKDRFPWVFVSLVFFAIGVVILLLESNLSQEYPFWKSLLSNIGAIFLVSGVYTVLSELFLKESWINLILSKINLEKSLYGTGVKSLETNLGSIKYQGLFEDCRRNKIEIIHVYGRTWTNNNKDAIVNFLKKSKKNIINVVLAEPANQQENIEALSTKYGISSTDLIARIHEVVDIWKSIDGEVNQARKKKQRNSTKHHKQVNIYFTSVLITHALYRFGDLIVFIPNSMSSAKTQNLNTIICEEKDYYNTFYASFSNEIEEVIHTARKVY